MGLHHAEAFVDYFRKASSSSVGQARTYASLHYPGEGGCLCFFFNGKAHFSFARISI
jgi:hypothetical protein